MCLLNYSKEKKKYKHLTYAERTMIERWYNREHLSKKEIAKRLDKSERTIRREIKRGTTINLNTYLEEIEVYSADIAHNEYLLNLGAKGKELKIGSNIELVNKIEKMIKKEKKSPEVIAYELNEQGLIDITARTIRNYIYDGNVFNLTEEDMIYNKKYKTKNKDKRIAKHTPPERSIENRPKEANERSEYGHWEGDLIIGKRKKGCVLLTFTERMTREEIIIKIKGKNNEYVVKAINVLERKYGKRFYTKFKTITFDNGVEFMDYEGMEKLDEKDYEVLSSYMSIIGEREEYLRYMKKIADNIFRSGFTYGLYGDRKRMEIKFDDKSCMIRTITTDTTETEGKGDWIDQNYTITAVENIFTFNNGEILWTTGKRVSSDGSNPWLTSAYQRWESDDIFDTSKSIYVDSPKYMTYKSGQRIYPPQISPYGLQVATQKIAYSHISEPYSDISECEFIIMDNEIDGKSK